jgi:hypothetical protein
MWSTPLRMGAWGSTHVCWSLLRLASLWTCEPLDLRAFGLGLVGEVVLGVADFIHFCGVWRVDGIAGEFVW